MGYASARRPRRWSRGGDPHQAVTLGLAVALAALTACIERAGFPCSSSSACVREGISGLCTAEGYCAFAAADCPSSWRYGHEAPNGLAGTCVSDSQLDSADAGDEPHGADASGPGDDDGGKLVDYVPANLLPGVFDPDAPALTCKSSDARVIVNTDLGTAVRASDGVSILPPGTTFEVVDQSGAPAIGLLRAGAVHVESGCTLEVEGQAALAIAAYGDVVIAGTIDLSGGRDSRADAGPGGFRGGGSTEPGQGPGGGRVELANGDVGAGGGGFGFIGGAGGMRAGMAGGGGGPSYGNAELVPLQGGSGGGGNGGGGGGALQVSARGALRVIGTISAGGAGGGGGLPENAGGGGGAGGAVLLEADRVTVMGTIAVNGGGGGAGADKSEPGTPGEPGGLGADRAQGGPSAGEGRGGGAGGAGGDPTGESGRSAAGTADDDNAGGGGGGGGRIRLRTNQIVRPGVLTPAAALSESTPL